MDESFDLTVYSPSKVTLSMISITGKNSKRINDPVFLSARKFMVERIARLEAEGPSKELDLAKKRYAGLTSKDVVIEPPVQGTNNIVRACFVSRKTGFMRVDINVEMVEVKDVFDEFEVSSNNYDLTEDLNRAIIDESQGPGVVFLKDLNQYGIVLNKDKLNPDGAFDIMNEIYWDKMTASLLDELDPITKSSGALIVESINIYPTTMALFSIEDIKASE